MVCRALVLADLVLLKVRHAEAFAHEACPRVSRYMTDERIDCNRYPKKARERKRDEVNQSTVTGDHAASPAIPLRWSVSLHFTPGCVANLRVGHCGFSVFKESAAAL